MAKIKLPSYIKEGGGRMEDAVIVTRGGKSYMMIYKKHDSGNSMGQKAVRSAFKTIVSDWKYLEGIISEAWSMPNRGTNVSGYNSFLGANMLRRRDGQPVILCPGMGEEQIMNFTAVPGKCAGEILCSFQPVGTGNHIAYFARRVTEPGIKAAITRYDAGAASHFTITGLDAGAQYHIWAVVTDRAYTEATTVSASAAAVSLAG